MTCFGTSILFYSVIGAKKAASSSSGFSSFLCNQKLLTILCISSAIFRFDVSRIVVGQPDCYLTYDVGYSIREKHSCKASIRYSNYNPW